MRLCIFGDSYVSGVGDPTGGGWVTPACVAAGNPALTVYPLGIRRDTSADIRQRWGDESARRLVADEPGGLVFAFGVNDCVWENGAVRVPPAQSCAHTHAILSAARMRGLAHRCGVSVLFLGPPPVADSAADVRIASLSEGLAACCAGVGVPYLPVFPALAVDPLWRAEVGAGDGAHPGTAGYGRLAALIAAWPPWQALVALR